MKRFILWLTLGFSAAAAMTSAAAVRSPEPQALAIQEAFRKVVAGVKPAVVSIDSVFSRSEPEVTFLFGDPAEILRRFLSGDQKASPVKQATPRLRRIKGIGSGVITDPRGYVLTNDHVVDGADEIKVIVRNPEETAYKGKIIGTDPASDLAVVKIEPRQGDFPYAALGDSDKVQVGDWAIAVGSPFGLEQTVTVGVISALRQSIRIAERDYSDFFQTDAAINEGNSGGPLLDIQGEVIGLNTAIFSPTGVFGGVGFAIPSNQAARIMKELIARGRVVRGYAGVDIIPLNDVLAARFKRPDQKGALVNAVVPDSPAARAGAARGDVVVGFDGQKVASPNALSKMIEQAPPGKKVPMLVVREGLARSLTVEIGTPPVKPAEIGARAPSGAGDDAPWEGAHLQNGSEELNALLRLPRDAAGVVVAEVDDGSAAEELGLQPGDLIMSINGRPVRDVAAFLSAAQAASLQAGVVLDVDRQGELLYLTFRQSR